jgi:hypothetical protein
MTKEQILTDDNANSPFDSHSVTISSDALGTLQFSGEGGSSTAGAIDTTAAGDLWDAFDGMTNADGQTDGADKSSATAVLETMLFSTHLQS